MNHEQQYNPRVYVGNVDKYLHRAAMCSEEARNELNGYFDIAYGHGSLMKCDIFPSGLPNSPVHVFIHGGYWRGRDKNDYSYIAKLLNRQGSTAVVANYDLCPNVEIDTIVDEIVTLFSWVSNNIALYQGDPSRIVASGHSAGAHLLAMACSPSLDRYVPDGVINKGVLISGIYDLEPVLKVSLNDIIKLTHDKAFAMSPLFHLPHGDLKWEIVVGGDESESWIAQSRFFYNSLKKNNSLHRYHLLSGLNHYSIMESLMDERSALSSIFKKLNGEQVKC